MPSRTTNTVLRVRGRYLVAALRLIGCAAKSAAEGTTAENKRSCRDLSEAISVLASFGGPGGTRILIDHPGECIPHRPLISSSAKVSTGSRLDIFRSLVVACNRSLSVCLVDLACGFPTQQPNARCVGTKRVNYRSLHDRFGGGGCSHGAIPQRV